MFETISRSWRFAKLSYGLILQNPALLLFPILSSIAALVVMASFILPLLRVGTIQMWAAQAEAGGGAVGDATMWVVLFLFYFCCYFVIVFFNTGLVACALSVIGGEQVGVGFGISFAMRRLPQILGWALVSAVIGVLLNTLERSSKKAAALVAMILGMTWSALTYFVVPIIVVEAVGPIEAVKRSIGALRRTWGTALVGVFSMGLLAVLIGMPIFSLLALLFMSATAAKSTAFAIILFALGILVLTIIVAATSAADAVFKAYLYCYAHGDDQLGGIDTSEFAAAFQSR
jgi:hypothetical protein